MVWPCGIQEPCGLEQQRSGGYGVGPTSGISAWLADHGPPVLFREHRCGATKLGCCVAHHDKRPSRQSHVRRSQRWCVCVGPWRCVLASAEWLGPVEGSVRNQWLAEGDVE